MFLIFIPVLVPYFQSFGLTMQEVFLTQVAFAISVVVFEVPSGYLCDLWGRKKIILIGSFINGLAFTLFVFMKSFWGFVLFEVLVGLAMSMVSGADLSLLYDSLHEDSRTETTKVVSRFQYYSLISEGIASVLGGLLAISSFADVMYAQAFVAWLPFLVAFSLVEPVFKKMDRHHHWENAVRIYRHLLRNEPVVRWVFINLVIWGLSTFLAVWLFQKNWQENGISIGLFGFLWGGYNLTSGIVSRQIPRMEGRWGTTPLLVWPAVLSIFGYFALTLTGGWWAVALGLAFPISRGISQVFLRDVLNWKIPSEFRATANSLSSLFFRLGFCLIGPLAGYSVDRWGLSVTFHWLGWLFVLMSVVCLLPLLRLMRQKTL